MAIENEKDKPNIRVLRDFMLAGRGKVRAGDIVAKADFKSAGDYMNLCAMTPPRAEQTADKPKRGSKLPGA